MKRSEPQRKSGENIFPWTAEIKPSADHLVFSTPAKLHLAKEKSKRRGVGDEKAGEKEVAV